MPEQKFKPFDEVATCPKCGGVHVGFMHSSAANLSTVALLMSRLLIGNDYMIRFCKRCGYRWHETPLSKRNAR